MPLLAQLAEIVSFVPVEFTVNRDRLRSHWKLSKKNALTMLQRHSQFFLNFLSKSVELLNISNKDAIGLGLRLDIETKGVRPPGRGEGGCNEKGMRMRKNRKKKGNKE